MSHEYLQVDMASSKLTRHSQGSDLDIKLTAVQSHLGINRQEVTIVCLFKAGKGLGSHFQQCLQSG
jgi:hypothetical protein